ncbi:MAG: SRPBCC family protein [Bacteroidota bacterium]
MTHWNSFSRKIIVNAPMEAIYSLWATPGGLENWFLRKAEFKDSSGRIRSGNEFIQKGDHYFWLWHGYADDVFESNPVLEADGKSLIRFIFSGQTEVEVKLSEIDGQTLVELTQSKIEFDNDPKENLYVQCSIGWTFYLSNLKCMAEKGPDLRNKNEQLQNVINA